MNKFKVRCVRPFSTCYPTQVFTVMTPKGVKVERSQSFGCEQEVGKTLHCTEQEAQFLFEEAPGCWEVVT